MSLKVSKIMVSYYVVSYQIVTNRVKVNNFTIIYYIIIYIQVGVNNSGVIQYSNCNLFEDNGYMINEQLTELGVDEYNNCYDESKWNYRSYDTITDNAKNTWCRSPGKINKYDLYH